jgi:hypothetical protein
LGNKWEGKEMFDAMLSSVSDTVYLVGWLQLQMTHCNVLVSFVSVPA